VEQPRETVPFAEIQFKDIQTLDRIVRFLVVPLESQRVAEMRLSFFLV